MKGVELQIQFQHIDAWLTQKSQVAILCMSPHKGANVVFFHTARMSNTRNLEFCGGRGDVWVQARARGRDQVNRDWNIRILRLQLLYITPYSFDQKLVGGTEIGAAAGSRIVSGSGAGRPRMEITRLRERLSDDPRAHNLAVSFDQLSVGSAGEQHLSQTCDGQGVKHPEHHRRNQSEPQRDQKILFHSVLKQP